MNFDYLKSFIIIYETKNITKAAAILHTSQPVLSRQLQQLETDLGGLLFIRKGKRLIVTSLGTQVYHMATQIMDSIGQMKNLSQNHNRLSIGAGLTTLYSYLPKVIESFSHRYPQVRLNVKTGNKGQIVQMVLKGDIDMGIVATVERYPLIRSLPLYSDQIGVFINNRRLESTDSFNLNSLEGKPFIAFPQGTQLRRDVDAILTLHRICPDIRMEVDQFDVILRMVRADLGVSILPRSIFDEYEYSNIHFINIPPNLWPEDSMQITRTVSAIMLREGSTNDLVEPFITICRDTASGIFPVNRS